MLERTKSWFPDYVGNQISSSFDSDRGSRLNLFVGFPFCSSKCHFCHWVAPYSSSSVVNSSGRYRDYTSAILSQINAVMRPFDQMIKFEVKDIYFGGGTPTIYPTDQIVEILDVLNSHIQPSWITKPITITIEASPDTSEVKRMTELRKAGFNRVSMGIQAFDDSVLRMMGRASRTHMAKSAVEAIRSAGFDNLNLDIMFGIGESMDSWVNTVERTVELQPEHISVYRFYPDARSVAGKLIRKGSFRVSKFEELLQRYNFAIEFLESHGYMESTAGLFAKYQDKKCTVDEAYFSLERQWLGFGAGATSYFGKGPSANHPIVEDFVKEPLITWIHPPAEEAFLTEITCNMLRTEGIDKTIFKARLPFSFEDLLEISKPIKSMLEHLTSQGGLIESEQALTWKDHFVRARWICS